MSEYTPTTEEVREHFVTGLWEMYPETKAGELGWMIKGFDRWLENVLQKAHIAERERIVEGLRMVADNVLKPGIYRDGYLQAMSDIKQDSLPNAPRFTLLAIVKGENK